MENLMQQVWVVPQSKKEVGEETCFVRFHLVPRLAIRVGAAHPGRLLLIRPPLPLGRPLWW